MRHIASWQLCSSCVHQDNNASWTEAENRSVELSLVIMALKLESHCVCKKTCMTVLMHLERLMCHAACLHKNRCFFTSCLYKAVAQSDFYGSLFHKLKKKSNCLFCHNSMSFVICKICNFTVASLNQWEKSLNSKFIITIQTFYLTILTLFFTILSL